MFACLPADFTPAVTVNCTSRQQTIDGFGVTQPQAGLTTALADLFFTNSAGCIGLTFLRLNIGSNSAGPTPYFPESPDMATFYNDTKLAAARGASVWATPVTAPNPTWKDNGSWVAGHLLSGHFGDYAAFLAGLQGDMHTNGGPALYAMSPVNEPDFDATPNSCMLMSSTDMIAFVKNNLGPALAALTPRPKLILPECANWDTSESYSAAILADATAAPYVDIVATHQYAGTVAPFNTTTKVWVSEMSGSGDTFDATITHGLTVAGWIDAALNAGAHSWHYFWAANTNNPDNEGVIGHAGDSIASPTMTKRFYTFGNFTKFVRPGYTRVSTSGTVANVSISAFLNTSTGELAVVAINRNSTAQNVKIGLQGLSCATLTPTLTDVANNLATQAPIGVSQGVFNSALPAASVTTFTGTGG